MLNGGMVEPEVVSVHSQDFYRQLEQKKEQLKVRLIDNDSDTSLKRAALRGELAGIEYTIRAHSLQFVS